MSETEPNEPPIPDESSGDDKEDYGAKGGEDRDGSNQESDEIVPEAD